MEEREAGEWKRVYDEAMEALEAEIRKSFDSAPANLVQRKQYSGVWPPEEEMRAEDRNYWLQRVVLETLAKVNTPRKVMPVLRSFELGGRPERLLHPAHGDLFRPIAFTMAFSAEFSDLQLVVARLLDCPLPLAVTSLNIERRAGGGAPSGAAAPRPGPAPTGPSGPSRTGGPPGGAASFMPPGLPMGPPPGVRLGPRTGAGTTPGASPSPARQRPAARAPAAKARETREGEDVVNVTLRGYVLEYSGPRGGGQGR
jgi:hypothetical protein